MAIYDCYNIRFNTGTNVLEMNTGGETWVPVPGGALPEGLSYVDEDNTGTLVVGPGNGIIDAGTGGNLTLEADSHLVLDSTDTIQVQQAVDFDSNPLTNTVFDNVAEDPADPAEGQIWYSSDTHTWRGFNGTDSGTLTFVPDGD